MRKQNQQNHPHNTLTDGYRNIGASICQIVAIIYHTKDNTIGQNNSNAAL